MTSGIDNNALEWWKDGATKHINGFVTPNFEVVIGDTDDGVSQSVDAYKIKRHGVLGHFKKGGKHYGVSMPRQGALMYEYLKVGRPKYGVTRIPSSEMRIYIDSCLTSVAPSPDSLGRKGVAVLVFGDSCVEFRGTRGSVVWVKDDDPKRPVYLPDSVPTLWSLYLILKLMCIRGKVNVFQYETLMFYSRVSKQLIPITLSQSKESKRFFLKLYMEMMRDAVHF